MHPRPIADTSSPLCPSLRVFIVASPFSENRSARSGPNGVGILRVADLLHPIDRTAVECFLNGDMAHRRGAGRAVPMLLAGFEPDHVAGTDFLDRATLALHPAEAGGDDQRLTKRMRVPRGASAGLEGDAGAANPRRLQGFDQGIDAHLACEIVRRSCAGGPGTASLDLHDLLPWMVWCRE